MSHERYLLLYMKHANAEGAGIPIPITLEELSETLHCTERNVKLILKKLGEDGFISWTGGRGRGNRSQITFLQPREKLLYQLAQLTAQKGEYRLAFELIDQFGEGTSVRSQFANWLNGHFGYRTEKVDDQDADILRLPVYRPILTLDPKDLYYSFSAHMVKQLFDCLVRFDRAADQIVPALAHAWESNSHGTEWTFHLRKGVFFHHGRELTADDVAYSLNRLQGSSASGWYVRSVARIEIKNKRTVKITLEKPNWLFPRFLCSPGLSIVPHELVEQDDHFWEHPVGTGPFHFMEWTADRFTMAANTQYFGGRAHLDGVVIVIMPENTFEYSKSWEQLLVDHDLREKEPKHGWQKIESVCNGCSLLTWNLGKQGIHQSADFRQGIDLLIDRSRMIRELGEDLIYPARGFHPNDLAASWEDRGDIELAIELIRQSGYDGTAIRICTYGIHEQDALWLKQHLAVYGVNITVQVETWETIREPHILRNADCLLYCVVFAEDEVCFIELYEQTGNFLRTHLDPKISGWVKNTIDDALASKEYVNLWQRLLSIEAKLKQEHMVIFLLHKKLNTYYNPNIKGVGVNSLGWIDLKDIWLEQASEPSS
ncbi:MarR-like DNA-binding transcriptional regulator SgrR of sgrS sRNA [Paenibacillus endophyticus]|uniref:MarR-like DNA-binding transcriptional regulator SgrR of sgrS sRNA n=1 Tax=Paenibacillus endophyticus TaxID=1294268 RepID=A0A7W5CBI5_9BACL|nr:SgrR family transcriptional regulator [Paenibacillus endophyticus]MBB3153754.1 MarR-like DNA-binding transcriptional regulator SgrR of sgrS sRNA [Paenibacillus endophyticus]